MLSLFVHDVVHECFGFHAWRRRAKANSLNILTDYDSKGESEEFLIIECCFSSF